MKRTFLAFLILGFLAIELSLPNPTTATHHEAPSNALVAGWFFVEVEAQLYRKGVEIDSDNPSERRWYFSNVVALPEDVPGYSLVKEKIVPYFSSNVMDPVESRGIALDYWQTGSPS